MYSRHLHLALSQDGEHAGDTTDRRLGLVSKPRHPTKASRKGKDGRKRTPFED